ncbi:MAG: hypothetical protein K0R56_2343 [Sphingomonas sp.]|jgi:hypothetical protein|nr:hypothetical protein [Sphingomonas sp.]
MVETSEQPRTTEPALQAAYVCCHANEYGPLSRNQNIQCVQDEA